MIDCLIFHIHYQMMLMDGRQRFHRFYCSFACQVGISKMCAPVVAIDAGHMKRKEWEGFVCLVACAIDGNRRNQLLAFAIVPSESEEHYMFFLNTMLGSDLNHFIAAKQLLCLTDRGNAVLASIRKSLPVGHIRYCAMHLLGNFASTLKIGSAERRCYNRIMYGSDKDTAECSLELLRRISPDVVAQLEGIGMDHIAETSMRSDVLTYGQRTSNLAEQRMAWLKEPVRGNDPVTGIVNLVLKLNRSYNNQIEDLQRAKAEKLVVSVFIYLFCTPCE